jgi:hypothetical protein
LSTNPRTPLSGFSELLERLDGLVAAAERADVDPLLLNVVRTVRRRLMRIQAYVNGQQPEESSSPLEPADLEDAEQLLEGLKGITEAASTQNIHPKVASYLAMGYQRVWDFYHHQEERRTAPRFPEDRPAWLWVAGEAHSVRGVDRSLIGFGILSPTPLEREAIVQLSFEPEGQEGETRYDCLVVYSFPEEGGYHIGLEVFGHRGPALPEGD